MEYPKLMKKLINKIKFFVILLLCLSFFSTTSYAKGGDDHSCDMLYVLGLSSSNNKDNINNTFVESNNLNKLQSMFDTINASLDDDNEFYNYLKSKFPYFNYGKSGHRLTFHHGFDADRSLYDRQQYQKELEKTFNEKFERGYEYYYKKTLTKEIKKQIQKQEWNKFLYELKINQENKKEELIASVEKTLFLNASYSEDIAALLYYTHLLGDHAGHSGPHTGKAVLEINKILANLNEYIKDLASGTPYYSEYENDLKSIRKLDERKDAENIIECLSNYIPKILKYKFSSEFANKNLIFRFKENLLKAS